MPTGRSVSELAARRLLQLNKSQSKYRYVGCMRLEENQVKYNDRANGEDHSCRRHHQYFQKYLLFRQMDVILYCLQRSKVGQRIKGVHGQSLRARAKKQLPALGRGRKKAVEMYITTQ